MLSDQDQRIIRRTASDSIAHGLQSRTPLPVRVDRYSDVLRADGATFVTLKLNGQLRGCIGSLEARRPLIEDVAENAFAAAFRDPRFPALNVAEYIGLSIHIAMLTPPESMSFHSEADLLNQIRPGEDGLVLEEPTQRRRGTFLPAVWESIPDPRQFLSQLKVKAKLPADYWSDTLRVSRYRTETIG